MNTASNILALQVAADRCTAAHGAHVTASIIEDATRLNLSDSELVMSLDKGFIPGPVAVMGSPSVKSLLKAARLTDAERALVAHKIASNEVATPAELRVFLQELARARVAARCAKLSPLPASELADVARLAGDLARAERAAQVAERDHAIHNGTLIIEARGPYGESSLGSASSSEPKRGVEEIPAAEPAPEVIPAAEPDPDRTLDLPQEVVLPSRPDIIIPARPSWPALPGQPANAQGDKLARAREVLGAAEKKAAHLAKPAPERTVVVAGDLAWVESSKGDARYRVEFEDGVPVMCGCRDPRAGFGGCKHADAAAQARAQGDGTYRGPVPTKPNPIARRQHVAP